MQSDMKNSKLRKRGIRLSRLNVMMICVSLLFAVGMAISMQRVRTSSRDMVTLTERHLRDQATAGKLGSLSVSMAEQARAFVEEPEPDKAFAFAGQRETLEDQLALITEEEFQGNGPLGVVDDAVAAWRENLATEIRAMRLAAEVLPAPVFAALPPFLQEAELSEEDKALNPEERSQLARSLLESKTYQENALLIADKVNTSQQLASEQMQNQLAAAADRNARMIRIQKILMILLMLLGFAALIVNRLLIIQPILNSAGNLDRGEQIPVQGSYEMRYLARTYNEVLKDNEEKKAALSYTATHDPLTGLYNRAAFDKAYRLSDGDRAGVVMLDVDYFKHYNDEYGHDIGDRVLRVVAEKLKENFRVDDHISRIGGDEFCIIMPGTDQEMAQSIVDKILQINEQLKDSGENLPPITISAGIAFWDRPNPKGDLLKDADTMLLEVKKQRTPCYAVYPGDHA